jgi:hypothetical protein
MSTTRTGVLPLAGEENWFVVNFVGSGNVNHPHVTIAGTDDIRFDMMNGSSCAAPSLSCPGEGNSPATNRTNWEVATTGGDVNGISCGAACGPNQCTCKTCSCTGTPYSPTPPVGTVYIKVHRVTGTPTCHPYTLTISS